MVVQGRGPTIAVAAGATRRAREDGERGRGGVAREGADTLRRANLRPGALTPRRRGFRRVGASEANRAGRGGDGRVGQRVGSASRIAGLEPRPEGGDALSVDGLGDARVCFALLLALAGGECGGTVGGGEGELDGDVARPRAVGASSFGARCARTPRVPGTGVIPIVGPEVFVVLGVARAEVGGRDRRHRAARTTVRGENRVAAG